MKSYFIYGKNQTFWNNIKHCWQKECHEIPSTVLVDIQIENLKKQGYKQVDDPTAVVVSNDPKVFVTIVFEGEKQKLHTIESLKKLGKTEEPKESSPKKVQKNSNREDEDNVDRQSFQSNRRSHRRCPINENW